MDLASLRPSIERVIEEIETVIVGKRPVIERALVALLANGHLLVEDVPGTGKTMLARSIARCVDGDFRRLQFTPDLLPSDITGTSIYNQKNQEFEFHPGPIFANVVLADEINRATPKTQSSLLEAMEEFQVTADGVSRPLPRPFFVIATQNSVEYQGTFPLPESQLDRFVMRLSMGYPSPREEADILGRQVRSHPIENVKPVISLQEVEAFQDLIRSVTASEPVREYIVDLVCATRESSQLVLGSSMRGSLDLLHCSQGLAALRGRDHVLPDDVKELAESVLAHRLITHPETRMRRIDAGQVVRDLLRQVPVPMLGTVGAASR
jgi:MoxR-like ATPase